MQLDVNVVLTLPNGTIGSAPSEEPGREHCDSLRGVGAVLVALVVLVLEPVAGAPTFQFFPAVLQRLDHAPGRGRFRAVTDLAERPPASSAFGRSLEPMEHS